MRSFWRASGLSSLDVDAHGGLVVTDAFLLHWLRRPEFGLAAADDPQARALSDLLSAQPRAPIDDTRLAALPDTSERERWRHFIRFRDRLLAAPNLQSAYARLYADAAAAGRIDVPAPYAERLSQIVVQQLLVDCDDGLVLRVAELWFRDQTVRRDGARVLLTDRLASEARGNVDLEVLDESNAPVYFDRDEAHGFTIDIAPGSGAARVFADLVARWVHRMIGVGVAVQPESAVEAGEWRWHVGLDAQASLLLDRIFRGEALAAGDSARLLLPLRLQFAQAADMLEEIAGTPVWLALAMDEGGGLRMKPQNLLFNLPLAARQ